MFCLFVCLFPLPAFVSLRFAELLLLFLLLFASVLYLVVFAAFFGMMMSEPSLFFSFAFLAASKAFVNFPLVSTVVFGLYQLVTIVYTVNDY